MEHGRGLLGRVRGAVVVVIDPNQGARTARSLDRLAAALLALIGGADARFDVLNVELARTAGGIDQRLAADLATLHVVRANVRQRERDGTICVVAVADERIDGDDRDAGVVRALQWFDHRLLVGRGNEQRIDFASDQRVHNRCLLNRVELSRSIDDQLSADLVRLGLGALLHGHVERITLDADDQGDRRTLRVQRARQRSHDQARGRGGREQPSAPPVKQVWHARLPPCK